MNTCDNCNGVARIRVLMGTDTLKLCADCTHKFRPHEQASIEPIGRQGEALVRSIGAEHAVNQPVQNLNA